MEEMQYHRIISKLVVTVKCLFLVNIAVWISVFRIENTAGQNFLMRVAIPGVGKFVLRPIYIFFAFVGRS